MIDQTLLGRIRRVAALTTSSNPNEAAAAAGKLNEMLLRHNLSMDDIGSEKAKSRYGKNDLVVAISSFHRTLWATVAKHHYCTVVYWPKSQRAVIVGEPHNVEVVEWMVPWLVEQLNPMAYEAYDNYRFRCELLGTRPLKAKGWMKTFRWGALRAISDRFEEIRSRVMADSKALVVCKESEVAVAVKDLVGEVKQSTNAVKGDHGAFGAGYKAGQRVGLERETAGSLRE